MCNLNLAVTFTQRQLKLKLNFVKLNYGCTLLMGLFDSIRLDLVSIATAIVAILFYLLFGWKKVLTLIPSELVIVITG